MSVLVKQEMKISNELRRLELYMELRRNLVKRLRGE